MKILSKADTPASQTRKGESKQEGNSPQSPQHAFSPLSFTGVRPGWSPLLLKEWDPASAWMLDAVWGCLKCEAKQGHWWGGQGYNVMCVACGVLRGHKAP